MPDWNFIELDAAKGERLLDLAAFQKWQADKHIESEDREAKDRALEEMRAEVKGQYEKIKAGIAQLTPAQARRLFLYLEGESLADITNYETLGVSRDTIYKTLVKVCKKWGWTLEELNQARAIWKYGRNYLE